MKKSATAAPPNNQNKSLNSCIFTTEMPPGTPRVSKDAPVSTKFEFGGLVR